MSALTAIGFAGGIYPVNPTGGRINGNELYRSLDEIPAQVDFAIIAVPAEHVPQNLKNAGPWVLQAPRSSLQVFPRPEQPRVRPWR